MRRLHRWTVVMLLLLPVTGRAADPLTDELSSRLRGLVIQFLPNPLLEDTKHWGGQKEVADGVTWHGKGLEVHPEVRYKLKNHGKWWKVRVTSPGNGDSLVLQLRDLQQPESGRMTFTAFIALDTEVDYERQVWEDGVRLHSGSVRARLHVELTLQCEATARLEPKEKGLPEMVFRLHVVKSDCHYDDLVVEHIIGLGGEAAKLIGNAARASVKHWHPSLERKLLDKANAAILKAGDTKEVHVSLTKVFKK